MFYFNTNIHSFEYDYRKKLILIKLFVTKKIKSLNTNTLFINIHNYIKSDHFLSSFNYDDSLFNYYVLLENIAHTQMRISPNHWRNDTDLPAKQTLRNWLSSRCHSNFVKHYYSLTQSSTPILNDDEKDWKSCSHNFEVCCLSFYLHMKLL